MATLCKDCHRPFAYTAHEETLSSHCQENGSYGCLRSQLTQARAEIAALREVVEAAEYLRSEASNYTRDDMGSKNTTVIDAIDDFDAARAKLADLPKRGGGV